MAVIVLTRDNLHFRPYLFDQLSRSPVLALSGGDITRTFTLSCYSTYG